jgi:hypothetical protein
MSANHEADSGILGLSPRDLRFALLSNAWGVLPIRRHDAPGHGRGKAPLIQRWQRFAEYDAERPSLADIIEWDRALAKAPGTGIPCGDVVSIDVDILDSSTARQVEATALQTFGPTPFVRQGRAPKLLLVFRAAEPIPSSAFKTLDGTGDGLDVLACRGTSVERA